MSTLRYAPIDNFVTHLKTRFNVNTLIETGTFEGESTLYAAERFDRVVTIDIRADFQEATKARCNGHTNIEYHHGDSREVLPKIVDELKESAIVWLDAHAAVGLFGEKDDWPILEEIEAITRSPLQHFILIDDAHCFLPGSPYAHVCPTLIQIQHLAMAGGYTCRVTHDVVALMPVLNALELDEFGPPSLFNQVPEAAPVAQEVRRRFHRNLSPPKLVCHATASQGALTMPIRKPGITEVVDTAYGRMIVLSHDTNQTGALRRGYALDHDQIMLCSSYLEHRPPGAVVLDIGACFGTYAFGLRPVATEIHTFEAQRMLANCIAGSVALNGWESIFCHHYAVGDTNDMIEIPKFDYAKTCSFGSIEFGLRQKERLHQERQLPDKPDLVRMLTIDDWHFPRVDFIKIDVEGMERKVLRGAKETIARSHPILLVEHIKLHAPTLAQEIQQLGYRLQNLGGDFLCTSVET